MRASQVGDGTVDGPADFEDGERPRPAVPAASHGAASPANDETVTAEPVTVQAASAANPETLTGREEE
jgi:hypothetical protein